MKGLEKKLSLSELSDATLWQAFLDGNREAFARIYQTHVRLLYNYGKQLSSDSELVKDCIQDLFVKLWQKRAGLGRTDAIKYYLFKCLRRSIIETSVRRQKQKLATVYTLDEAVVFPHETTLIEGEKQKQQRAQLAQALSRLPARQQEVLFLLYYEGLNHAQAAEIMSITVRSVYTLAWKAVGSLRQEMLPLVSALLSLALAGTLMIGF